MESESPTAIIEIFFCVFFGMSEEATATIARSLSASAPFSVPSTASSSQNVTVISSLSLITWLFVAIRSSLSVFPTMMPLPALTS